MEMLARKLRRYVKIGIALTAEKDINKLLEMIVDEARGLSKADAGTLYLLGRDKKTLRFAILQNTSMRTRIGGMKGTAPPLKDVELYDKNGNENHSNVSSHVALTGEAVNIPDVYETEEFDFNGPREYDDSTGYKSKSMLVIPLKNHEETIIGVLQLLNAIDPSSGNVIPFAPVYEEMVAALASQAAVALTNVQLIDELKNLFYAFIQSIATAIEEKSPFTGGHIKRVVDLTMIIANHINKKKSGHFKNINFSEEELEELRIATWMHDVGKITTPEYIVNKETKLHTLNDKFKNIKTRFALIKKITEVEHLNAKLNKRSSGSADLSEPENLESQLQNELNDIDNDLNFLKRCNEPGEFLHDDAIDKIKVIGSKTYRLNGKTFNYLTPSEIENLCIRKGTLNTCERKKIESHAIMTINILEALPFPKNLSKVPEYAGGHHEKLDGSGYPRGLTEKELPLQARIMAIADIFESLTAKDRPYREPISLSKALSIMKSMKEDHHIDPNILDLFINDGLFEEYADNELDPKQIDMYKPECSLTG